MKILITGIAGFIGVNAGLKFLKNGDKVIGIDDLSRKGTPYNLKLLKSANGGKLNFIKGDICNFNLINRVIKANPDIKLILHLAAQVAVTTSVVEPVDDFKTNAVGTLNLLEAMRLNKSRAVMIFSSTNKVYGQMENVKIKEINGRYQYVDLKKGVPEEFLLDFHSPYGCSKGCADQYVRDYGRIYGLKTIVFRQSCVYGINQFGIEDQGWLSHFVIRAVLRRSINIYGDGKQVRDALYIDDLIDAYETAYKKIKKSAGEIYNIGGGAENQISLLESIKIIEEVLKTKIQLKFFPWRTGDQKIFVSDNSKLTGELGWMQKINVRYGITRLILWVQKNKDVIERIV